MAGKIQISVLSVPISSIPKAYEYCTKEDTRKEGTEPFEWGDKSIIEVTRGQR